MVWVWGLLREQAWNRKDIWEASAGGGGGGTQSASRQEKCTRTNRAADTPLHIYLLISVFYYIVNPIQNSQWMEGCKFQELILKL